MMHILQYQENSRQFPNKTVISYRDANKNWPTITWKAFWEMICQIGNGLKDLGVQKGDKVGIMSHNSKEWVAMDVAIQVIHAVTVPIYATSSADQAIFIIKQTEMKVILVGDDEQYAMIQALNEEHQLGLTILTAYSNEHTTDKVHDFNTWLKQYPSELVVETPKHDDLATIVYTSGTTGTPKGVMHTHGGMLDVIDAHVKFLNIENLHDTKSLGFLPLSHIFERAWMLFVLSQAGEIAILDNPREIAEALLEVKPNTMCSVPRLYEKIYQAVLSKTRKASATKQALFSKALEVGKAYSDRQRLGKSIPLGLSLQHKFFDKLVFSKIRAQMGGNLRFLPVGGAMLKKEISEFFAYVGLPLKLGYGLTETTATVTVYPEKNYIHGSVGKPLVGVDLKLSKEGEILIKYGGVMKGYYKNKEATDAVFTEDGYFRTGDKGELDADGNLFIVDRIKDLMKTSNGKYIAPQSVELPLQTCPEIEQLVIVAEGKPFVTALIVPNFELLSPDFTSPDDFMKLSDADKEKLLYSELTQKQFKHVISKAQEKFAPYEKVKKFKLLPREFSIEEGELTPTLKVKRKIVLEKHNALIDQMYA